VCETNFTARVGPCSKAAAAAATKSYIFAIINRQVAGLFDMKKKIIIINK